MEILDNRKISIKEVGISISGYIGRCKKKC